MRIKRDWLFMATAEAFALRSTCPRASVGVVIVRDNHIVSHGYNGSLPGDPHCEDIGCALTLGTEMGCQRTVHAETNAILYAAKHGIAMDDCVMYTTHEPCIQCATAIIMTGIRRVIFRDEYRKGAHGFLRLHGVYVAQLMNDGDHLLEFRASAI